jgi:hypothetical protein
MKALLASLTLRDWLTLAIAGMALLLSIYSLYLQRRDKNPRLRVRWSHDSRDRTLTYDPTTDTVHRTSRLALIATIHNVGTMHVRLVKAQVRWGLGGWRDVPLSWSAKGSDLPPDTSTEGHAFNGDVLLAVQWWLPTHLPLFEVALVDHMDRRWGGTLLWVTRDAANTTA